MKDDFKDVLILGLIEALRRLNALLHRDEEFARVFGEWRRVD